MNFGVISPKIKTTTVVTAVETKEESILGFLINNANNNVEIVAALMFTMLFPTKIVEINISKFSSAKTKTFVALLFPLEARVLNLILLAQEKAVSVAEKNPENRIKIISATNNWTDPSGILPPKKIKLFLYFIIKWKIYILKLIVFMLKVY